MHMTQCCCVCSPCCASEFQNFLCLQSKFGTLPVAGPPPVRRESASDPARKGDHAAAVRLHLAHFTQRNALRGAYNPSALWHMARLPPLQKPHNARLCVLISLPSVISGTEPSAQRPRGERGERPHQEAVFSLCSVPGAGGNGSTSAPVSAAAAPGHTPPAGRERSFSTPSPVLAV